MVNSYFGYRSLPPALDGEPLLYTTSPDRFRHYTFAGALRDSSNSMGNGTDKYYIYNDPFLTHDAENLVDEPPSGPNQGLNGKRTTTIYSSLGGSVGLESSNFPFSFNLEPFTCQRFTTSITPSFVPSVVTGVAPLSVFFDSTGTTSTRTPNAWKDCLFGIDSGDTNSDNYVYGVRAGQSKRKNLGGPTWGHVYPVPGTYYAEQEVFDGQGYSFKTVQIVVQDPDVVFSGTNTICCSLTGTFTGAPVGSNNQTVASLAAALAFLATGKRVLLQTSDTWTTASSFFMTGSKDNMVLGAFGGGRATVTMTAGQTFVILNQAGISRLQIRDIALNGASITGAKFIQGTSGLTSTNVHLYNWKSSDSLWLSRIPQSLYHKLSRRACQGRWRICRYLWSSN
jgi:hypothetical protein